MFKKISTLALASFSALAIHAAYAGGPDYSQEVPFTYSGVYLEGTLGYALRDWGTVFNTSTITNDSNLRGGFSGGFDLGYQFNEYFSIEGGWLYLPQYKESLAGNTDELNSWFAYGGFKITAPLIRNLFIFGKLAAAYTKVDARSNTVVGVNYNGKNTYWEPLFGAGLQYYFNQNISIHFQYLRLPGRAKVNTAAGRTPNADIFLVGAGYKFAI